jgi:hypothetical protein
MKDARKHSPNYYYPIKSAKLLAQSTGDFIRAELNDDVR